MPVFLEAPRHNPRGRDGKGRNRLEVGGGFGVSDQCALKVTGASHLREAWDTRHARWGGHGSCTRKGACEGCPTWAGLDEPTELRSFAPRVLFRINERDGGRPWAMNKPEDGWGSHGYPWTWERLVRLQGWRWAGSYRDEESDGFWLAAEWESHGVYGIRPRAGVA